MPESDLIKISDYLMEFSQCMSKDHFIKTGARVYIPLIGDPCYNFSRGAKETFFKKPHLAFLFLFFTPQIKGKQGQFNKKVVKALIDEARSFLMRSDRVDLLQFLKK